MPRPKPEYKVWDIIRYEWEQYEVLSIKEYVTAKELREYFYKYEATKWQRLYEVVLIHPDPTDVLEDDID